MKRFFYLRHCNGFEYITELGGDDVVLGPPRKGVQLTPGPSGAVDISRIEKPDAEIKGAVAFAP